MPMPKGHQKYPGYSPTLFGHQLRVIRESLELSRKELARRANIHQGDKRTLRRIEEGQNSVAPEVRQTLLSALHQVGAERGWQHGLEELQRLAGLSVSETAPAVAPVMSRRELVATAAPAILDLGGSPRRRGRLDQDEALDAPERPTSYVHLVRNLARADVDLLRDAAWIEIERLAPFVRGRYIGQGKEEASRATARWLILVAASYQEDDQDQLEGIQAALAAQGLARKIHDRFLEQLAIWYEAALWRKRGYYQEDDPQAFDVARMLLETLIDSPVSPTIQAFAYVERAKIALADEEGDEVFVDCLRNGQKAAQAAIDAARWGVGEAEAWLPFFAEHVYAVMWDAELRGYAAFGLPDRDALGKAVVETKRFDEGLSFNIRRITIPLGEAAALWRLDDERAHRHALMRWWEGQQSARETDQRQQLIRGQKLIWRNQEVQRKLPREIDVWCDRCQDMTTSVRRGPIGATYRCQQRRNGQACDYVTINLGSADE